MNDEFADVRRALRDAGAGAPPASDHIDDVTLAELIDGVLAADDRAGVEEHLARCARCRQILADAGTWVHSESPIRDASPIDAQVGGAQDVAVPTPLRRSGRHPRRRWWRSIAALVVIGIGIGLFLQMTRQRERDHLAAFGVSAEVFGAADRTLIRRARRAAEGIWPGGETFAAFDSGPHPTALRSGESRQGPLPLAPRWHTVDATRPIFRWSAAPGVASAPQSRGPLRFEILLVDAEERAVAFLEAVTDPAVGNVPIEISMADTSPPLTRGATYAWKVNVEVDGVWSASEYVPFRVLSSEESARLSAALIAAGDTAFLRATTLAAFGLDDEALVALAESPIETATRDVIARALLDRQRLPESAVETALARVRAP